MGFLQLIHQQLLKGEVIKQHHKGNRYQHSTPEEPAFRLVRGYIIFSLEIGMIYYHEQYKRPGKHSACNTVKYIYHSLAQYCFQRIVYYPVLYIQCAISYSTVLYSVGRT